MIGKKNGGQRLSRSFRPFPFIPYSLTLFPISLNSRPSVRSKEDQAGRKEKAPEAEDVSGLGLGVWNADKAYFSVVTIVDQLVERPPGYPAV